MNKLTVRLANGYLIATICEDPYYPGIDIEYIDDEDNATDLSRPRILIESPTDSNGIIRALVWNDPENEDYETEVELYDPKYKRGEC